MVPRSDWTSGWSTHITAKAVEGDVLDKGAIGRAGGIEGAVIVEMLGIDVGDDDDVGRKLDEGAVRFIGFDHHPVALAEAGIGAIGVDDAAVDHRLVETAAIEEGGNQQVVVVLPCVPPTATQDLNRMSSASISARRTIGSRRSRAAASSGLSALTAEEMTTTGVAKILLAMADLDRDAELAEPCDIVVVGEVGSLNRIAERLHHLGDAHANAANPDEVDGAGLARKLHGSGPFHCRCGLTCPGLCCCFGIARQALDKIGQPLGGVRST